MNVIVIKSKNLKKICLLSVVTLICTLSSNYFYKILVIKFI